MGQNDHAAIQAILAGDRDAYGPLVMRHSPALFRAAYRITGNEADAEDVVQEALMRAYRKLDRFEQRANFGTWLYRIAVRCALDRLAARRSEEAVRVGERTDPEEEEIQVATTAAGPEQLLLSGELKAMRALAMRSLSTTEHAAFVLRHLEGCGTEEIAAALGIQPSAAKQAVFRAVQKLRMRLAPLKVNR
ncbi:MAG: sigma-70 family RNA polymerase sigma factor [Terracidiphilus sp.]